MIVTKTISIGDGREITIETGKLAKQAAETLQIVQQQERRSWGIDPAALGENAGSLVVLIERTCQPAT